MYRISWYGGHEKTFLNIGLLPVFTVLFASAMASLAKARRAELFAASAAYCAVLIVFIGNFGDGGSA